MIHVPAGTFTREGRPVRVAAFFLDQAPVTVAAFRVHRSASAPTFAERFGGGTFSLERGRFEITAGADWEHPLGDGALAEDEAPVTQLTAEEAEDFCRARDARLPTEDEWEHAARNATNSQSDYPWGDDLLDAHGRPRANVWQGAFPTANTLADGFLFASPVGAFAPTPLGFSDLVGNVWQWTSTNTSTTSSTMFVDEAVGSPALPETAPSSARVIRGGSFLCDPRVCHGYRIRARQSADPRSPLLHVGFRCAASE